MRPRLITLALSLGIASAANAQAVRGVVITPDSALVPGVIVTLLDPKGVPVARALSDEEGRYLLRAPAPGTFHIEARRLAFLPTVDLPLELEEGKIRLHNVVVTGARVQLQPVQVTANAPCRVDPDSASTAFRVWEEARKALRASQLTRLTRPYKVDVTTYVKRFSPNIERDRMVDSSTRLAMPIRPFTSRSAEELVEFGYMSRAGRNEVFHAPDEDVLLSDSFAATHCLRMLPDSAPSGGLVRLAFEPIPSRQKPDIAGTLTVDRATSELRRLDFTFVNLPLTYQVGTPGGEIVFRQLPDRSWLIDEWAIRLPVAVQVAQGPMAMSGQPTRVPTVAAPSVAMRYGLQTTGGHVIRVTSGEETLWARPVARPKEP